MQLHYRINWYLLRLLFKSYFRFTISGEEHIPPTGPLLIAANHCSHLDPPMIALALHRQVRIMAKKELFSVPVLGWWIRWIGGYPIVRGKSDLAGIRTMLRLLKEENAVLVFPEGTRSMTGKLNSLQEGTAWLATRARVPVVPIQVQGTFDAFPPGDAFPKPKKVSLQVHPAIQVDEWIELDNPQAYLNERMVQALQGNTVEQASVALKPEEDSGESVEHLNTH